MTDLLIRRLLVAAVALMAVAAAHANEPAPAFSPWIAGAGVVKGANPYAGDTDGVTAIIPIVGYLGERLTWLGPNISYRALDCGEDCSVSLIASARLQGFEDPAAGGPLDGLADRDAALEAGFAARRGRWRLAVSEDLSGVHHGAEARLDYRIPFSAGRRLSWQVVPGVAWQDARLANYYYGVRATEATAQRAAYRTGPALNATVSAQLRYFVTRRWMVMGQARITFLDTGIRRSPIVDNTFETSALASVVYRFPAAQ